MSEVKRFKKKPVEVEAMQVTALALHEGLLEEWSDGAVEFGAMVTAASGLVVNEHVLVDTLEGTMRGNLGDWIIKGVRGEFYPCERTIFEETYEEVTGV